MTLDCPNKLSSSTTFLHPQDTNPGHAAALGTANSPFGTAGRLGRGVGGYALSSSRQWTLNCLLSRQRNRAQGKLCPSPLSIRSYSCSPVPRNVTARGRLLRRDVTAWTAIIFNVSGPCYVVTACRPKGGLPPQALSSAFVLLTTSRPQPLRSRVIPSNPE